MSITKSLLAFSCLAFSALAFAQEPAPVCGTNIKEGVSRRIWALSNLPADEKLKAEAQLYDAYKYCAPETPNPSDTDGNVSIAALQCETKVAYQGSTYFEEMPCCGYDPQRRAFACPVRIKQGGGFGTAPWPGSREYTFHCVQNNTTGVWYPVGVDSVHLANSQFRPGWQFAVVANAIQNLQTVQPLNGEPRLARSILSWGLQPTSCNYKPIWGNVIEYKIRLDQ